MFLNSSIKVIVTWCYGIPLFLRRQQPTSGGTVWSSDLQLVVVVVYPLPWPLLVGGGESDIPACCPPANFSVHLASSAVTPVGDVHKSRGDNMVRMWGQLKRWCVSCVWMLQRGHSGNGCVLASTLCKYDLRICSELGNGATSEAGMSLFRAANVVEVCTVFCYCLLWLDALQ